MWQVCVPIARASAWKTSALLPSYALSASIRVCTRTRALAGKRAAMAPKARGRARKAMPRAMTHAKTALIASTPSIPMKRIPKQLPIITTAPNASWPTTISTAIVAVARAYLSVWRPTS